MSEATKMSADDIEKKEYNIPRTQRKSAACSASTYSAADATLRLYQCLREQESERERERERERRE